MISEFSQIETLLIEIDKKMKKRVSIYVIGGAALMHHGVGKGYTKDIDVVLNSESDFAIFRSALRSYGFSTKRKPLSHNELEIWEMLEKEHHRFDLFVKSVCRGFSLSSGMIKRSDIGITLGRLRVCFCSKEDIVIFKSLSPDRQNDIEDSVDLIKRGIDWNIILEELRVQVDIAKVPKRKKELIWYFIERLDDLKKRGVVIPIEEKILELYDSLPDIEQE